MSEQSSSSNMPLELLQSEYDKKIKELRIAKKEITVIIRENQKIQAELKSKNETINALINQNFNELKLLQEKHDNIVENITSNYDKNINKLNDKYKLFQSSLQNRMKENINVHYKVSHVKVNLLTEQNKILENKIIELQSELKQVYENNSIIDNQLKLLNTKFTDLDNRHQNLDQTKLLLEQRHKELNSLYETQVQTKIEQDKIINSLTFQKEKLENELHSAKQELNRNEENIKKLTSDTEQTKNAYQEMYHKHVLLLNDNISKQNNIDEKTLEILSLNSKVNEFEKKNALLDTNRIEANVKINEFINQIDTLQTEIVSAQKIIHQLKTEKEVILDEKIYYNREYDKYKQLMVESENNVLEKIKYLQDAHTKEKEKVITEYENKLKDFRDKSEKQVMLLRSDFNSTVADKDKQIEGYMNHLKSFTDNQYLILQETEKIKLLNEKLRAEQTNIDQKLNEIHFQYKKEIEELKTTNKKEKDLLVESYNENIKKSQELNDALQNRLNQTMEALGLSKTAIANLKETNQNLEKQIHARDSEEMSYQEKYNQMKNEYNSLKENLEKSIELNNTMSNKEKQYESQIRQLQHKCAQLVSIATKNQKGTNSIQQ